MCIRILIPWKVNIWNTEKMAKFAGVIETCSELPSYGVLNSDFYFIDPDGKGVNEIPIKAWCNIEENSTWVKGSMKYPLQFDISKFTK